MSRRKNKESSKNYSREHSISKEELIKEQQRKVSESMRRRIQLFCSKVIWLREKYQLTTNVLEEYVKDATPGLVISTDFDWLSPASPFKIEKVKHPENLNETTLDGILFQLRPLTLSDLSFDTLLNDWVKMNKNTHKCDEISAWVKSFREEFATFGVPKGVSEYAAIKPQFNGKITNQQMAKAYIYGETLHTSSEWNDVLDSTSIHQRFEAAWLFAVSLALLSFKFYEHIIQYEEEASTLGITTNHSVGYDKEYLFVSSSMIFFTDVGKENLDLLLEEINKTSNQESLRLANNEKSLSTFISQEEIAKRAKSEPEEFEFRFTELKINHWRLTNESENDWASKVLNGLRDHLEINFQDNKPESSMIELASIFGVFGLCLGLRSKDDNNAKFVTPFIKDPDCFYDLTTPALTNFLYLILSLFGGQISWEIRNKIHPSLKIERTITWKEISKLKPGWILPLNPILDFLDSVYSMALFPTGHNVDALMDTFNNEGKISEKIDNSWSLPVNWHTDELHKNEDFNRLVGALYSDNSKNFIHLIVKESLSGENSFVIDYSVNGFHQNEPTS